MKTNDPISTSQLLNDIEKSTDLTSYLSDHKDTFLSLSFTDYLKELLETRHMTPSDLIHTALFERSYIYHILSGKRTPSRKTILQIAILLQLSIPETQLLLQLAGRSLLYAKIQSDAAILFCLSKHMNLLETNELLTQLDIAVLNESRNE